jgi:hypothetical protein
MAYSKAKLKSSGDKSSPYFRPFWIGKLSEKYLRVWTLTYVLFKHILISQRLRKWRYTPEPLL